MVRFLERFWGGTLLDCIQVKTAEILTLNVSEALTVAAGKKVTKGVTIERSLSKTANYTVLDTDPDLIFIGALSAHATITLPTAADNAGRTITVILAGDPGAYNVIVDGEGSEAINGATTKTNSDQYSMIKVTCNGTGWFVTASAGTWT